MCKWNVRIFIKHSKQNANHYSVTSKMQTSWGHYSDNSWFFLFDIFSNDLEEQLSNIFS